MDFDSNRVSKENEQRPWKGSSRKIRLKKYTDDRKDAEHKLQKDTDQRTAIRKEALNEKKSRLLARLAMKKRKRESSTPEAHVVSTPSPTQEAPDTERVAVSAAPQKLTKEIEINHLRNKYLLTNLETQAKLSRESGAQVETRGRYFPDPKLAETSNEKLLHVFIEGTKDSIKKAEELVKSIINQDLGPLTYIRRTDAFGAESKLLENGPSLPAAKFHSEKIDKIKQIGIDRNCPLVRKLFLGEGGVNIKHIESQTDCRVELKGKYSRRIDPATGMEEQVPLYVHFWGFDKEQMDEADKLITDLIDYVKGEIYGGSHASADSSQHISATNRVLDPEPVVQTENKDDLSAKHEIDTTSSQTPVNVLERQNESSFTEVTPSSRNSIRPPPPKPSASHFLRPRPPPPPPRKQEERHPPPPPKSNTFGEK